MDRGRGRNVRNKRSRGRCTGNVSDRNIGSMPNVVLSGIGSNRGTNRGRMIRDNVPARTRGRGRGGGQVIVDDFIQATSSNLPVISCYSVANYYENLLSSELRQSKDQM